MNSEFLLRTAILLLLVVAAAAALCFLALFFRDRLITTHPRKAADISNAEVQVLNNFCEESGDSIDHGIPYGATPATALPLRADEGNSNESFHKSLDVLRKSGKREMAKLLAERDAFAAKRLKILRSLENGKDTEKNSIFSQAKLEARTRKAASNVAASWSARRPKGENHCE